ncbi:MAG: ATP-binding protein [Ruminococcaceae bacterium]|nr:ATP-binding protein [Oscillospiraceae bacterium]
MKELSLNILDVTENSVKAGATLTQIIITEKSRKMTIVIKDNGCGMNAEILKGVTDPFYTTRTTRKVGMGLPLLKMAAEMSGGKMTVASISVDDDKQNHGTTVTAEFDMDNIDFTPLGDIIATITTLIQGHPDTDFEFCHETEKGIVKLETLMLRELLEDVPLSSYEVIKWIEEYLREQYESLG